MNVFDVWRWQVLRSTVRVVRTGHVQDMLNTTKAVAERSTFIRRHVFGKLQEVLRWTLVEHIRYRPEACAVEVLSKASRKGSIRIHLGGGFSPSSSDPIRWARHHVPPLERRSGGCGAGIGSDRRASGPL